MAHSLAVAVSFDRRALTGIWSAVRVLSLTVTKGSRCTVRLSSRGARCYAPKMIEERHSLTPQAAGLDSTDIGVSRAPR